MGPEVISNFLNLLQDMPIWFQGVIILLLSPIAFLAYFMIKYKGFRNVILEYIKNRQKETVYELKNHDIFLSKSIHLKYIENMDFNSKLKNDIFRKILTIKVNKVVDEINIFCKKNICKIKDIDLLMTATIDKMVEGYEKEIYKALKTKYKDDADYLYNKIYTDNFKPYHNHNITYILKTINIYSDSRLTNNQKVYMFLNLLSIALDMAILDCERIFDKLNGSLNKYNEKWYK